VSDTFISILSSFEVLRVAVVGVGVMSYLHIEGRGITLVRPSDS